GLTIAALYQSILAFLLHLRENNQRWRQYRRILVLENKWRAQRYGVEAQMGDFGRRTTQPLADLIEELIDYLRPHADNLGCLAEVEHARVIAKRGTSADHQLKIFNDAVADGASDREAQIKVVDWLVEQSVADHSPQAAH
ncbi:MAG: carboxylate-amine ligase, partial [Pseudomonadota bacterium]